ncbi:MAG: CopG family transcriptional regulator [Thermoprotei archaeon]|nr:MAG: CopG family transcriptional regulator [Thermoprotei archaeon]RLE99349.1 MAG: CopG family transcriptional regulator [Thermoprotei archaeon]HDI74877.1 ribbon-helix-helix protein, CopG family [Thermoprotei archaeon]
MRRRFGISISRELADNLDSLAKALETDRSSIVENAIREYIHDHLHYLTPHECTGVMILYRVCRQGEWFTIIDKYRDIVVSYTHVHKEGVCIEILVVSGHSEKIAELHKELGKLGIKARYLPISYLCLKEKS